MKYLLFFTVFINTFLSAQTIPLSGKIVVDDDPQFVLERIKIKNLASNSEVLTDSLGVFLVNTNPGDELLFSHEGLQERKIKISYGILQRRFLNVHLNVKVIELKEVGIAKLNKDAIRNIGKEKLFGDKINEQMGIVTPDFKSKLELKQQKVLTNRVISQVGGVNIIGLLSILTGAYEKVGEVRKVKELSEKQQNDLKKFYTEYYFIEDLKIPKKNVDGFITYCFQNFNFKKLIKENDYDEILRVLQEQAPLYLDKLNT